MDDEQETTQEQEQEQEQDDERSVPKRSMRDRLRRAVPTEPSTSDPADERDADAETDQRALENEFWNKK